MTVEAVGRGLGRVLSRLAIAISTSLVFGCSGPGVDIGGETHFLKSCAPDGESCGKGLSCICGVCTLSCNEQSCSEFPGAQCVSISGPLVCGSNDAVERCDVTCKADDECALVSSFHVCSGGVCRTEAPTVIVPPATSMPADDSSQNQSSMEADAAAVVPLNDCPASSTTPNEVLIMGDSFFALSHQVTAYLEELARTDGALPAGERYRDASRVAANTLAGAETVIADQYTQAAADSAVSVVIMTGGGADALLATCDPMDSNCPGLADAAAAAETLLGNMASGGVEHVVYTFYPESPDTLLNEKLNALRPLIERACSLAPVTCHWVDLRPVFNGRAEEYLAADGALPTAQGSRATAETIWSVMQDNCIAQ